jgi:hypothetical protein
MNSRDPSMTSATAASNAKPACEGLFRHRERG